MAMGRRGMVCTSQGLATSAGIDVLRRGGDAVDAAVVAAAVLGVVEPFSTGIGGDCFALVWRADESQLYAINGSGRAPSGLSIETLTGRGLSAIPAHGPVPVTVPGAVAAWADLLDRFGQFSLADALAPAIAYAVDGFPVTEVIAHQWDLIAQFGVLQNDDARRSFTPEGRAPRLGEVFRVPSLGRSMASIAEGGPRAFYEGEIADKIDAWARADGGFIRKADLVAHRSTWVEPISGSYRGHRLYELPPNGQGIAALIALHILERFDVQKHPLDSAAGTHLRIEAMKLAYADRNRYVADPEFENIPVAELLSDAYADRRAASIDPERALAEPQAGEVPRGSDTVYLTTADEHGNVVSFINSLFMPFGAGVVAGDTGIALQNRGYGFATDPAHPNCLRPGKRPLHTIIPAMLFRNGRPLLSFGVMGGNIQAQGHMQVVSNMVDHGLNIQEALDRARFHYMAGTTVAMERQFPDGLAERLRAMGHDAQGEEAAALHGGFGGGQGILIDPATGAYWGGSDRRKDGCALGY